MAISTGATQTLIRLSQIAVVDAKRDEVLRVMKNHMTNSNGFVRKSATEVFCTWATAEQLPELRKVLEDPDGLMFGVPARCLSHPSDSKMSILGISQPPASNPPTLQFASCPV